MNKILKGAILSLILIAGIYFINFLLEIIFNYSFQYHIVLRLLAVSIVATILNVLLSTFSYYYCGRSYKTLWHSTSIVLFTCMYFIFFVYGFSWLTLFQILIPLTYATGIKNVLKDDFGYQMSEGNRIVRERNEMRLKQILESKKNSSNL